ncbi:MAG: small multi-drug export protein [Candidatus Aenigmarchaeota archaeon]|nr:small multi-drug export protein [Candidatus Aenigmarchaeota archaeon]
MFEKEIMVALANVIPTTEQIGGISLGLTLGLNPATVLLISLTVNCLLFFPIYFGLTFIHDKFLYKIKIFDKYLDHVQRKGKPYVDKYGIFGLTLFIALPTPLTGTYTASILGWFLDLDWKKAFLAIAVGSTIGAFVIYFGYFGIYNILKAMINL